MIDVMEIDIDRPEKVVYVVGIGPGEPFYMTQQAANTLESVDAICGYKVYLDLIRDEFPCEEYYATGMTQELDRCRWALKKARTGKRVALVCSGDAGVYGMASPLLELAPDYPDVAVVIVPGLTAALSGGAVLGAPLAHDFCVISLSDRLTPWEVIEKRLACAAMGDFCSNESGIIPQPETPSGCGKSRKTPCRRNSAKTVIRQPSNGCFARKIPCKKANCCQTNWYAEPKTCCQKTDSKYNRKTSRFQAACKTSCQNGNCKPAGKETRSANTSTARPQRTGHL